MSVDAILLHESDYAPHYWYAIPQMPLPFLFHRLSAKAAGTQQPPVYWQAAPLSVAADAAEIRQ